MMTMTRRAGVVLALAGSALVAPAVAQPPSATAVVVVRPTDDSGAPAGAVAGTAALGFVAGEAYVIASVDAGMTEFVVSGAEGAERDARLVASDEASGLGLLAVPGLTARPYSFARDPARRGQEVYGATRGEASGTVTFVNGRVQQVQPVAAATSPGAIQHDAFSARQRNLGAPLLNVCGEVVGAVVDELEADSGSPGSGRAVPAAWVLAQFAAAGLTASSVESPCLTAAERAAATAEEAAIEAARRAAVAEVAAAEAAQRAATAEADAVEAADRATAAEAKTEEAQQAAMAAAEAQQRAEQQAAANWARYMRWTGVAGIVVAAAALLLWLVSRRSVATAKQGQVKAETLAQATRAELVERDARERLASAVPAVVLTGADPDGRPVAFRIPGRTIADTGGAVVGRNPFDSTVVIDHTEVSRRHFRLSARGMSVLIEDLNSMNGTIVDDTALIPGTAALLANGAVLHVGGLSLIVTLEA